MNCVNCGEPVRLTEERDGIEKHDGRYEFEYVHDSGPEVSGNPICPIPCVAWPDGNRRMSGAEPPVCRSCGAVDPLPEPTCDGGQPGGRLRDHFVGMDRGCQHCGRLVQACMARPCQEVRAMGHAIEDGSE